MSKENLPLRFFYNTKLGRMVLKIFIRPSFSNLIFYYLNSPLSKIQIKSYIKKQNIDMNRFEEKEYKSFNDFFIRQIKDRNIKIDSNNLVSPSDGHISYYKLNENSSFYIKNVEYSVKSLLNDESLANKYKDGICLIVRLAPYNYHRYMFIDNGKIVKQEKIPGVLHTVRQIACEKYPVYIQNSREYAVMETENLGTIVQIEVGALLVGRIKNYKDIVSFKAGEEKGYFEFGGSTVAILLEKDKVKLDDDILINENNGIEKNIKIGERIGKVIK